MDVIDQTNGSELPPVLHKPARRFRWILVLAVVSITLCALPAYFWTNIEAVLATQPTREPAPVPLLAPEDREALSEIRSGQRQAIDEIAELNRNIGTQQADLKRMADQIEALTTKIVALQNLPLAASVPPAAPPPAPRPILRPAKRTMQPSKPEGPVSVRGAPLTPETDSDQR
ncbi:hypothetical protein ACRQ5Q_09740 [Bradyrhizobium sp. PMVTL-01]|uniref:hypothetical protein n=1 Tax=Bradyrhizobium sp. PMVTL-01 TaxID=3434999 RepID=UPI003F72DE25